MKQVVLTALYVLLTAFAFGQYSISGTITDITNGEVLINVTVQMEGTEKGTQKGNGRGTAEERTSLRDGEEEHKVDGGRGEEHEEGEDEEAVALLHDLAKLE